MKKRCENIFKKKNAQVWVETAIYTLIGLTIIAIILTGVTPQIEKAKDKSIITQTGDAMKLLDKKINDVSQAPGYVGIVEFKIAKGKLEINSSNDLIVYTLENTKLEFSEPGVDIRDGGITIRTEKAGSNFNILLITNYSNSYNLTHKNNEESKILQAGATAYKIQIQNKGDNRANEKIHLDFNII